MDTIMSEGGVNGMFFSKKKGPIRIPFSPLNTPVSWYAINHVTAVGSAPQSAGNNCTVSYEMARHEDMDYLIRVMSEICIPEVSVKDEFRHLYRIRWTDHLAYIIMNIMTLKLGEVEVSLDYHAAVFYLEYLILKEKKEDYYRAVGQVPKFQTPSTTLRAGILDPIIPFFVSGDISSSIPLFLTNKSEKIVCQIKPVLELSKLIVMEMIDDDGVFHPCVFQPEVITGPAAITMPIMRFQYSRIRDNVKVYWREGCHRDEDDEDETKEEVDDNDEKYPNYLINFVSTDPGDAKGYNLTDSSRFTDPSIHKMFFWASQNRKSIKYNIYTNYSSNPYYPSDGQDPVERNELKYSLKGVMKRFSEPSHFFNGSFTAEQFNSTSNVVGHKAFTFSHSATRYPLDSGVPLFPLNGELSVKYRDGSTLNDDERASNDGFTLILRSGVINKLIVKDGTFNLVINSYVSPV